MRRWLLGLLAPWCAWAALAASPAPWQLATTELPPSIGQHVPQQGYYAVMLRRILSEMGVEAQLHFLPPQRSVQATMAGAFDAAFPLKRTPERERAMFFSEPFYQARVRVFVRREQASVPASVAELASRRGCALQGMQLPESVQGLRIDRAAHVDSCLRMLLLARVDYVISAENAGWVAAASLPDKGATLQMAPLLLAVEPVHLAFPRLLPQSAARVRDFNIALKRLRDRGVLQAIEREHVPRARDTAPP